MAKSMGTESGYRRYFLLFDLCALGFVVTMALSYSGSGGDWTSLVALIWMGLLFFLFTRKRRDEFAQHCWAKATEAAFVMLVVATVVWAFAVGVYDGFTDRDSRLALAPDPVVDIVFGTFFVSFEWARYRGGM